MYATCFHNLFLNPDFFLKHTSEVLSPIYSPVGLYLCVSFSLTYYSVPCVMHRSSYMCTTLPPLQPTVPLHCSILNLPDVSPASVDQWLNAHPGTKRLLLDSWSGRVPRLWADPQ